MRECALQIFQIQLDAFVAVDDQQLAVALVVRILNDQVRRAAVDPGQHQLVTHIFPGLVGDFPLRAFLLEDVEIQVIDQLLRQIAADKRDVRVQLSYLEHFVTVPAALDVLEDLQPQVVRVEALPGGLNNRGIELGVFHRLLRRQVQLAHNPLMPIRSPALVHDLRFHLRPEIEHFVTQHGHDVALPIFQRR
ncbi:hypothetical protein D3C74_314990 [compost metagenome]